MPTLSLPSLDARILRIEAAHPVHSTAKEQIIARDTRLSPVRYYQLLGRIVQTEAALAAHPFVVKRVLRRVSATGARRRVPEM